MKSFRKELWFNTVNADAHLKRQIMGREVVVAVTNGRRQGRSQGCHRP